MCEGCYVIFWDSFCADEVVERRTVTHVQCLIEEEKPEVIVAWAIILHVQNLCGFNDLQSPYQVIGRPFVKGSRSD